jgi:hypothetical protein
MRQRYGFSSWLRSTGQCSHRHLRHTPAAGNLEPIYGSTSAQINALEKRACRVCRRKAQTAAWHLEIVGANEVLMRYATGNGVGVLAPVGTSSLEER